METNHLSKAKSVHPLYKITCIDNPMIRYFEFESNILALDACNHNIMNQISHVLWIHGHLVNGHMSSIYHKAMLDVYFYNQPTLQTF